MTQSGQKLSGRSPEDASWFYDTLAARRSIRDFDPEPIATEVIERLLTAARNAPSAHNQQPWRFCVILDESDKARLAQSMGEALRDDRISEGIDPDEAQAEVDRSYDRITGAPVVIVFCLTMEDMDRYLDESCSHSEYLMAVQSVAMAGENLLLMAHAEGLGACWMCAPLFTQDIVREVLDLPSSWEPQGMIILGHPAHEGRDRSRMPLDRVVLWR
jgi:coenzyme F420-0:L-glutamate ligase/coenzyme F420-1:gamma-L-glutamate ligase